MAARSSFTGAFQLALKTQFTAMRKWFHNPLGWMMAWAGLLILAGPVMRGAGPAFLGLSLVGIGVIMGVVPVLSAAFLAFSSGYRKRAAIEEANISRQAMLHKLSRVVENLTSPGRHRFTVLHTRVNRLADLYNDPTGVVRPGENLLWLYLKLLLARDHLDELNSSMDMSAIESERADIEADLARHDLSDTARNSKIDTLQLIERRLLSCRQRAVRIEEVESDLARIEHKVALLHDRAAQQTTLGDAGIRIDMFSDNLSLSSLPVTASRQVEDLDAFFAAQTET